MSIINELHAFFEYLSKTDTVLYNEPGLQHELAIYLRERLVPDEIKLEYPKDRILGLSGDKADSQQLNNIKKECSDIYLRIGDMRYVIELRMPRQENNGISDAKLEAVKDIIYLQGLLDLQPPRNPITACYSIFLSEDERFWYSYGNDSCFIHEYFYRDWVHVTPIRENYVPVYENDHKLAALGIQKEYRAQWKSLAIEEKAYRYYILELQ